LQKKQSDCRITTEGTLEKIISSEGQLPGAGLEYGAVVQPKTMQGRKISGERGGFSGAKLEERDSRGGPAREPWGKRSFRSSQKYVDQEGFGEKNPCHKDRLPRFHFFVKIS